jgi:hypothetical protein
MNLIIFLIEIMIARIIMYEPLNLKFMVPMYTLLNYEMSARW